MHQKRNVLAALAGGMALGLLGAAAQGGVLVQYTFPGAGLYGTVNQAYVTATTVDPSVSPTIISNGTTGSYLAVGDGSGSSIFGSNGTGGVLVQDSNSPHYPYNEGLSIGDNVFFTFTVTPTSGPISLTNLTFDVNGYASQYANGHCYVFDSVDGFATANLDGSNEVGGALKIADLTMTGSPLPVTVDLSAARFQNLSSPITFRVYTMDGFGGSNTYDSVTLNGSAGAVPEPASLGLLALGATALLARRRRNA